MWEKFKYIFFRYKFIFLGLVIADYLINVFTGSGLDIFVNYLFFIASIISSFVLYLLILIVILAFRWNKLPSE